jgi:hypothetical protein
MRLISRSSRTVFRRASGAVALLSMFAALAALPVGSSAQTIDFETLPNLPAQPNNFAAAGVMQTYTLPGVFSISGGVVLGNPSFLPAFALHGSAPNLYGTTDIADPSLLDSITLLFPQAEGVLGVSGVLFNGQTIAEDYTVQAFDAGNALVDTFTANGVPDNTDPNGVANFVVSFANPITQVVITTPNAATNGWDFFVDTITLRVQPASGVPEPSAWMMMTTMACGLACAGWRARRRGRQT